MPGSWPKWKRAPLAGGALTVAGGSWKITPPRFGHPAPGRTAPKRRCVLLEPDNSNLITKGAPRLSTNAFTIPGPSFSWGNKGKEDNAGATRDMKCFRRHFYFTSGWYSVEFNNEITGSPSVLIAESPNCRLVIRTGRIYRVVGKRKSNKIDVPGIY